jgi:hypothetical protein
MRHLAFDVFLLLQDSNWESDYLPTASAKGLRFICNEKNFDDLQNVVIEPRERLEGRVECARDRCGAGGDASSHRHLLVA